MIFVTVGTNEAPFDRLLRAVGALAGADELVVQHGSSSMVPPDAVTFDFLPFDRLVEYVQQASVVVTHAGVGSITVALTNGKRPIVVPRLSRFGEAVDDHQLVFGRHFAAAGLVTLVESPGALADAVPGEHRRAPLVPGASGLATDLKRFLEQRLEPSSIVATT